MWGVRRKRSQKDCRGFGGALGKKLRWGGERTGFRLGHAEMAMSVQSHVEILSRWAGVQAWSSGERVG